MPDDQISLVEIDKSVGVNSTESTGVCVIASVNGPTPAFTKPDSVLDLADIAFQESQAAIQTAIANEHTHAFAKPEPAYTEAENTELNEPKTKTKIKRLIVAKPKHNNGWIDLTQDIVNNFVLGEKTEAQLIMDYTPPDHKNQVFVTKSGNSRSPTYTFKLAESDKNSRNRVRFRRIVPTSIFVHGIKSNFFRDRLYDIYAKGNVVLYDAVIEGVDFNTDEAKHWNKYDGIWFDYKGKKYFRFIIQSKLLITNCPEPIPFDIDVNIHDTDEVVQIWSKWLNNNAEAAYEKTKTSLKKAELEYIKAQRSYGHHNMLRSMIMNSMNNFIKKQISQILTIPQVQVMFCRSYVKLTTEKIIINYENKDYYIGSFNIYLYNDFSAIKISHNNRVPDCSWHPHASSDGSFCTGGFANTIGQCILDFDFYSAILIVLEMLRSVNPKDEIAVRRLLRDFSTTEFCGSPNEDDKSTLFEIDPLLKTYPDDDDDEDD